MMSHEPRVQTGVITSTKWIDRGISKDIVATFKGHIFTAHKRSCGKVMFLHVPVILFTGGGCIPACITGHMAHTPGRHPPGQRPPNGQWTSGTHSTGMHYCWPSTYQGETWSPYPEIGNTNFTCALWTFKQQWAPKCLCVVEFLLFSNKHRCTVHFGICLNPWILESVLRLWITISIHCQILTQLFQNFTTCV